MIKLWTIRSDEDLDLYLDSTAIYSNEHAMVIMFRIFNLNIEQLIWFLSTATVA